jgi:AraC-like DNA-binding protein
MNAKLFSFVHGPIQLIPGMPPGNQARLLPEAPACHAVLDTGTIIFQELRTGGCLLRYFVFSFFERIILAAQEESEGLQSIVSLKGDLEHRITGEESCRLSEGQFILLNAGSQNTETTIPAGKECHLLNTYYSAQHYTELLPLFPSLYPQPLSVADFRRVMFPFPKPVGVAVLDALQSLFHRHPRVQLQRLNFEMKLKQALFAQLAQALPEHAQRYPTRQESEMAWKAREIIMEDLSLHHSNEDLALKIGWSVSSLKRAFRREFGLGPYEFLRLMRLERAHPLLQQGWAVKCVAVAVGMRPSNLTTEFKRHFGYKATALRGEGARGSW